jgi:menaquinone-dependent protoporphyrinogen oxidase
MNILIVYGTVEGQTRKVAEFLASRFRSQAQNVDLLDAGKMGLGPDPADYDATILASPVRMGAYRRPVVRFAERHHEALNRGRTALVSVSMAAANTHNRDQAQIELRSWVAQLDEKTEWHPGEVIHVAGGLPYTQYGFITRWIMRRIARDQGGDTDTSRDYEYTDWDALGRFADAFVAKASRPHLALVA